MYLRDEVIDKKAANAAVHASSAFKESVKTLFNQQIEAKQELEVTKCSENGNLTREQAEEEVPPLNVYQRMIPPQARADILTTLVENSAPNEKVADKPVSFARKFEGRCFFSKSKSADKDRNQHVHFAGEEKKEDKSMQLPSAKRKLQ